MTIDNDGMVRFTQALVQQKTLSGEERPGMELVAREMQRLGLDEVTTDEYGNVTGVVNGAHSGPTLLVDCHVDTVDIAPGVPWQYEPFGATIDGDRLYGRGAADMKGPLAATIYAAAAADRSKLAGRVVVSASVMEEVIEGYLLEPIIKRYEPDFVVIGEPTNNQLSYGGRGRAEIHLEAIGVPSHSSSPHLGVNAVLLMMEAIKVAEALPMPSDPVLGTAVMGLTDIVSAPFPGNSMIPSCCRVTYDRRTLAGETVEDVLAPLQGIDRVTANLGLAEYTTYTGQGLSLPKFFPAWKMDLNHNLVQASLAGLRRAELPGEQRVYQFCTDAAYTAGVLGLPTVGFGPSEENQAHIVDEYLVLSELVAAAQGYQGIIEAVLS